MVQGLNNKVNNKVNNIKKKQSFEKKRKGY